MGSNRKAPEKPLSEVWPRVGSEQLAQSRMLPQACSLSVTSGKPQDQLGRAPACLAAPRLVKV